MSSESEQRAYSTKSKSSVRFWKRVNAVPSSEGGLLLYTMGCILQDVESRVLRELEELESKYRARRGKKS